MGWRVIHGTIDSADGTTKDFTSAGAGYTPNGYMVWMCSASTLGTAVANSKISYGFTDGTSQFCVAGQAEDAQGTSDTDALPASNRVGQLIDDTQTVLCAVSHNSFISNGVRLNLNTKPASGNYLICIVIIDDSCHVDSVRALTTSTVTVSPGFAPTLCFPILWPYTNLSGRSNYYSTAGVSDGTVNRSHSNQSSNGQTTTLSASKVDETYSGVAITSTGSLDSLTINNMDADSYDLVPAADWSSRQVATLCVGTTRSVKVGTNNSPTSTGSAWTEDSSLGFQPGFILFGCTMLSTIAFNNSTESGLWGFAGSDGTTSFNCYHADEDALATVSNTETGMDDQILRMPLSSGSGGWAATGMSFTSTGWTTSNPSAADSTARKWWYVAIEADAAAGGTAELAAIKRRQRNPLIRM